MSYYAPGTSLEQIARNEKLRQDRRDRLRAGGRVEPMPPMQQGGGKGGFGQQPTSNAIDYNRPTEPVQTNYGTPTQTNLGNQLTQQSEYDGLRAVPNTNYYYGDGKMYEKSNYSGGKGAPSGLTSFGGQNFVPVNDANVQGFNRLDTDGNVTYQPSKAMGASLNQGTYQPQSVQSVTNFLQPPQQNLTGYGAGRFMPQNNFTQPNRGYGFNDGGGYNRPPVSGAMSGGKGAGGGRPAPTAGGKG